MTNRGISLIEAVLALLLIAITLATIIPVFANYSQINSSNEVRTTAVLIAQERMDELRRISPDDYNSVLGASPVSTNITENGKTYNLVLSYENCSAVFSSCTSSGAKYVNLKVYYNSDLFYEVENVFTRLE